MSKAVRITLLFLGLAALTPASAEATRMDFQVAARALSFIQSPPSGDVRVGIVYSTAEPATQREAGRIERLLGDGLRVGNINLEPVVVDADAAGAADVDVFFLTDRLGKRAAVIAELSASQDIPCVTTDIEQVRAGACALGVRSRPKVEILVNRALAEQSGAQFATAFRMMVTEL